MFLVAELAMLGLGVAMLIIARPREGKLVSFLTPRYAEITYSMVVTVLIGMGVMTMLGSLVGLFG